MDRAERRRLARLMKARAKRKRVCAGRSHDPAVVGQYARTPHPCSCGMCGNPRPYEGPSHAECRQARTHTDEEPQK